MSDIIGQAEELNFNSQQISSRVHVTVIMLKMEVGEHRQASARQPPRVIFLHVPQQPWEFWILHAAHLIKSNYALCTFAQAFKNVSQKMKTTASKTSQNECLQHFLLWEGCFLRSALFICESVTKLGHWAKHFHGIIKSEIKSIKT